MLAHRADFADGAGAASVVLLIPNTGAGRVAIFFAREFRPRNERLQKRRYGLLTKACFDDLGAKRVHN